MQECLAATGNNTYIIAIVAIVLLVIGSGLLRIFRGNLKGLFIGTLAIGVVAAAGGSMAITVPANAADCGSPSASANLVSTPGTTVGEAGTPQLFNSLAHATPSGGAQLVPSSLRLAAIDSPVVGTTVSADELTVTAPGEGVYSAQSDGSIIFTPEAGFAGTARGVRFLLRDTSGNQTSNQYTPTVKAAACEELLADKDNVGVYFIFDGDDFFDAWASPVDEIWWHTANGGSRLTPAEVAALAPYIDLDPSQAGIQTTLDYSQDQGWSAGINPVTGEITVNIVDAAKLVANTPDFHDIILSFAANNGYCA